MNISSQKTDPSSEAEVVILDRILQPAHTYQTTRHKAKEVLTMPDESTEHEEPPVKYPDVLMMYDDIVSRDPSLASWFICLIVSALMPNPTHSRIEPSRSLVPLCQRDALRQGPTQ